MQLIMKTTRQIAASVFALMLAMGTNVSFAQPLASGFTYQGELSDNGVPASGTVDILFRLYDGSGAAVSPTYTASDVPLDSMGRFTVEIPFDLTAFNGNERYLDIRVRPGDSVGAYTTLSPRQRLSAAPYALYALNNQPGPAGPPGTTAWSGLTGIPTGFADNIDNDTTYTAGTGVTVSSTTISLNQTYTDARYWQSSAAILGDVTGVLGSTVVSSLRGRSVSATAPSTGNSLVWNGTAWAPASPAVGGDITGTVGSATVTALRGRPVASTTPNPGDLLTFVSGSWTPGQATLAGDVIGTNTASEVRGLRARPLGPGVPTGGDTLIWNGTNWNPAQPTLSGDVSGSTGAAAVVAIRGRTVANIAPMSNQLLRWDSVDARWEPSSLSVSDLPAHTHSASDIVSGVLAIANGGTGASTASSARSNLGAAGTSVSNTFTAGQSIDGQTATTVELTLNGAAGKVTDFLQARNNSGTSLFRITAAGNALVSGNLVATGEVQSPEFNYVTTQSRTLSIAAAALRATDSEFTYNVSVSGSLIADIQVGNVAYIAPFTLPHDARVTSITCFITDTNNTANKNITIEVITKAFGSNSQSETIISTVATSGNPGVSTITTGSLTYNPNDAYYIRASWPGDCGSGCAVAGFRINYEVDSAGK